MLCYDVHGGFGAEDESSRRWCPWKTVSWYGHECPSSEALVVLAQREVQRESFVGFGNNRRKYLSTPGEGRRKMVNVIEFLRGLILGVYLCKPLGILRIIWKNLSVDGGRVWDYSVSSTTTLFLLLVWCNLGKWATFEFQCFKSVVSLILSWVFIW